MSKAFEDACIALQIFAGDERGREIVATRIIDLARKGVIDAKALKDRVLLEARSGAQISQASSLRAYTSRVLPSTRRQRSSPTR